MDSPISRAEHNEFMKRMEEEHARQNKRISNVEKATEQLGSIVTSVEKLALNMEMMLKEQEKQGKRLDELEGRDGEMWRKVVSYIITAICGAIVCFIFTQLGM